MNDNPADLSLSNFLAGEGGDPLQAPASFTRWMEAGAWAVELYEPEMRAPAEARTTITYGGRPQPVINLCSYNYLGLANHPEVIAAAHEALTTHGLGACGSPMLSGMTDLHRELERKIAQFLGREDAMLFNSGFGGALGTISGLLRKTDVAVLDNRSHLSLRDGATLSRCRAEKFEHNDPAALDASLGRHKGKRQLVVIEGIYSMDGDFGNLAELITVAESHGASVFIDEAHSILACGEHGRGAAEKFEVEDRVRLTYGTFSKAFGGLGGFVAGSRETLQYLRFYAHPYVYSCALPPVVVAAILKALEIGTSQPELRRQLWENAEYFHHHLCGMGIDTGNSTTYVMPIVIGDRERMYRLGHELRARGLWVAPVDYPAVPQDRICFRACVTALHTRADLDEALNILSDTLVPAQIAQHA
ncbi:MAG TPA: aminotransferase class I/II-fold pyridoxal phosphate-dependent enzyme [Chthoniobacterales bacterium]|jgi:glycine C-acetyltransferase|nr:aminotransferase class I/II-fold pyridoxal phosphate-dependent enzyme [Chthoniobacterales bacterium]